MIKLLKKADKIVLAIILIMAITVGVKLFSSYRTSASIGSAIGNITGEMVGNLIGSYEGYKNGYEDGLIDAQKPKIDTEISQKIKMIGKLEVLRIDFDYLNVYRTTESVTPDYAIAYTEKVSMVFTVDLNQVRVEPSSGGITIYLPQVEASDPNPDINSYHVVDEYKTGKGDVNEAIQHEGENHTKLMNEIKEKVESTYKKQAENAAITQVTELANALTSNKVTVEFASSETNNEKR